MEYLVIVLAGLFAGIATGLVGLSAAAIIVPLFATVLGMDPYIAVGIALASDVLASGLSAVTYAKNKNIDIKHGLIMLIAVLIFTVVASYVSSLRDTKSLGGMMNILVIILGINFLRKNKMTPKEPRIGGVKKNLKLKALLWGSMIGIICGYMGAGGGVMLLMVLTSVLGYELKTAVGTSVFIMAFTALIGAASHIIIGGTDIITLVICVVTALLGAWIASLYANKIDSRKLNVVVGMFLILFGIVLTLIKQLL